MKQILIWNGSGYEETTFDSLPLNKNTMIKIVEIPDPPKKHNWQWYMNGSFCRDCGAAIGDDRPCQ